jgi:branched-chain amino acid transport system permease protein
MKKLSLPSWIPTVIVGLIIYFGINYARSDGLISAYRYQVFQIALITVISALGLNLIYGFNGQFSLGHIGFYAIGAYGSALITKDYVTAWSGARAGALSWMMAAQLGVVAGLVLLRVLRLDRLRRRFALHTSTYLQPHEVRLITLLPVLFITALVVGAAILATQGLHLVLFQGLNALMEAMPRETGRHVVFFLALLNGGTMAALVAYLVGLPLLRLGSDYFGIATLGFAIMVFTALQNSDLVIETMKGARGMVAIPVWTNWTWVIGTFAVLAFIMRNLLRSSHGRAVISVREDEVAAQTMGVDVNQLKTLAFTVGGLFAGVGGALYAHLYGFLHPSTFSVIKGFDPLIIIVLGGLGSMTGTVLAGVGVVVLIEELRVFLPQGFEDWRFVIYPIILLLVMLLRSQGIMGTAEWGWFRAPLPPERDIPVPNRRPRASTTVTQVEEA